MIGASFFSLIPLMLGLATVQPAAVQTVTRLVVQEGVILRIPIEPRGMVPQVHWQEKKGPKCIPAGAIRGALLSGPEQVDFLLFDRSRVRAEFDEDCPALDFYNGFYVQPKGEKLCAGRDAIHSRIGGSCTIERFKVLVPHFAR